MVVTFVGVSLCRGPFWDALKHGSPLCGGPFFGEVFFWDALKHGSPHCGGLSLRRSFVDAQWMGGSLCEGPSLGWPLCQGSFLEIFGQETQGSRADLRKGKKSPKTTFEILERTYESFKT